MQRLIYKEYRGCKDILTIDLHNGYTILAIKIWNKEKQNYTVKLRIKENTVEKWNLVEEAESLTFNITYKFINSAILKQVVEFAENGFFYNYIEQYEYELKCFDRGHNLFEEERCVNA